MFIVDFMIHWQIMLGLLGAACLFVPWNQRRSYFPLRTVLGTVVLFLVLRYIPVLAMPPASLQLLLYTVLIVLWVWVCFDCSIVHAIFSATCAYTVQHIASKLTYLVVMLLMSQGSLGKETIVLLLLLANALVCMPIFLQFTRRFFKEGRLMFDSVRTVMLSGLFLFVAVFLSSLLESNLDSASNTYLTSYLALNAFCILFAAVILSMEFANCSIKRLENEKMILEQLLENDKLQYEQAKKDMEKINIRYHDLKQQYSRASDEEREKLEAEIKAIHLRYYTGNKALDIVLTQKSVVCENADIQFVCSIDGSCLSEMKHYHIYSLLGNAIDNAIECLAKVEYTSKKVINLDISRFNDMAVIRMENYMPTLPILHNGVLVTTKQDTSGHGYGMKSIYNIAELYGGTADYFVEDEVFCLLVTLPYIETKEQPSADAVAS